MRNDTHPWTWERALSGVIPPLITPLEDDGRPDSLALAALVEHTLSGGCSGLFVLGGCGAGPWLTSGDRHLVLTTVVGAARGRCPVLAGVMMPSTRTTVEAARRALDDGADAIVVTSPYYFPVDGAAQQRHLETVLRAAPAPALLYNIPQCTHHRLALSTVATLAAEPGVLGIKDSAGDLGEFLEFVAIKRRRPEFKILQGSEPLMAASLQHGGDGLIPGLANVAPQLFVALHRAAAELDAGACRLIQERIVALKAIERDGWLAGLMGACAVIGLGTGTPPAPYAPATDEHRARIEEILGELGLSVMAV
jgi:4-hydroxy-tetrahydrodipicolinate synthase